MRWGNRLLYNNDKVKPIASVGVVKVTSVQAIGDSGLSGQKWYFIADKQTKVVELVTFTPPTDAIGLSLSFLLHHIYYLYL